MTYKEQLDKNRIPKHVAIIMDGNGRWAKERGLTRSEGHQKGADSIREVTAEAVRIGIKYLTLYTFSTENWNRPVEEVSTLMGLVLTSLTKDIFMENNVKLQCIGDFSRVPPEVMAHINQVIDDTKNNTNMTVISAFSYSSRWEITKAMQEIAQEVKDGKLNANDITEKDIS